MGGNDNDRPRPLMMPDDALPCVWMTAGILSYRLCDRNYDCENCPLDAALRGEDSPDRSRWTGVPPWTFPDDRLYHPAHVWVLPLDRRRARLGLDSLAARLLGRLSAAILPAVGAHLELGSAVGWFEDDGELIPVRAALSGVVDRVNHRVQSDPSRVTDAPYDDGWLLEIRCREAPERIPGLESAQAIERRSAIDLARLWRRAGMTGARTIAEVGPTLADGGEPLDRLRQGLDRERYHRLIVALLG